MMLPVASFDRQAGVPTRQCMRASPLQLFLLLIAVLLLGGCPSRDGSDGTTSSTGAHYTVVPGDTLHIKVQKDRTRGNVWKFAGKAYVGDKLCAEAVYTAMLVPRDGLSPEASA